MERFHKSPGTIVDQTEPVKGLRPAMTEVIMKEKVSDKVWAASLIDLAIRGYIKITEEQRSVYGKVASHLFFFLSVAFIIAAVSFSPLLLSQIRDFTAHPQMSLALLIVFLLLIFGVLRALRLTFNKLKAGRVVVKDYLIELAAEYDFDERLNAYEKRLLDIILIGNRFSTKLTKRGMQDAWALRRAILNLRRELYKETERKTKAFEKSISNNQRLVPAVLYTLSLFLVVIDWLNYPLLPVPAHQIVVSFFCLLGVYVFIHSEGRLNSFGRVLREQLLGFKHYLAGMQMHRAAGTLPAHFSEHLAYAIVFGVEQKWSSVPDLTNTLQPQWFAIKTPDGRVLPRVSEAGGFSYPSFAASFVSSIESAFSGWGILLSSPEEERTQGQEVAPEGDVQILGGSGVREAEISDVAVDSRSAGALQSTSREEEKSGGSGAS